MVKLQANKTASYLTAESMRIRGGVGLMPVSYSSIVTLKDRVNKTKQMF